MALQRFNTIAYGSVPDAVWQSKAFWILMIIMIIAIYFYHNYYSKNKINNIFSNKGENPKAENKSFDKPKISYTSEGPSGYVHIENKRSKFALYYEFGSGSCVANIHILNPESWEKLTKIPLAQRYEILEFIGQQVIKDQIKDGRGYYKIEGDWLNIYNQS